IPYLNDDKSLNIPAELESENILLDSIVEFIIYDNENTKNLSKEESNTLIIKRNIIAHNIDYLNSVKLVKSYDDFIGILVAVGISFRLKHENDFYNKYYVEWDKCELFRTSNNLINQILSRIDFLI